MRWETAPSPQPLSRRERGFKQGNVMPHSSSENYQTGFANEFATEAVAGALPVGRNSPQQVAHGLYAEQLSGTAFTAPRAQNRRSWLYRILPAAMHGSFSPFVQAGFHNDFGNGAVSPEQLRWSPLPLPGTPTDFIEGQMCIRDRMYTAAKASSTSPASPTISMRAWRRCASPASNSWTRLTPISMSSTSASRSLSLIHI